MQEIDYIRAASAAEVSALLAEHGDAARVLSGGTDLIIQLRENRRSARLLVDVKSVPELNELFYDPVGGLFIGAAVPCWRICSHAEAAALYPGLIDAVSLIGGTQVQGRASLGGNLCNASPAADSIPALIVHRAECLVNGPAGSRRVAAESFCTAPGQTVLGRGEFLMGLRVPPPEARSGAHYLRFIPRNEMDIAVAGAGAAVVLDEGLERFLSARLALAAVAPVPLFVPEVGEYLAGKPANGETLAEAARLAREAARPISDMRGTTAQRKHLSGVLARRALEKALERARM